MSAVETVTFKGLRAYSSAYALDESGTVMLSLVGSTTVLNGLWAAFLSHEVLLVNEQTPLRRMRKAEENGQIKTLSQKPASDYVTLSARLRESGKRHTVMVHRQATQACEMDRAFFVLEEQAESAPLARFCAQFTRAVAVCARPDWSAFLWERGLAGGLVMPCAAVGLSAWRVSAEGGPWAALIRHGFVSQAIR